ncbi:hypothetical protein [Deinococcus sp. Leaf326]|uniref:hypothetical protein n=1 Tax=Deinococcus sp. Leaf326 TaxID=1736338 RepID=UPI000B0293EA|nr:hypothetical protein [Deinococcus sp. Leaf326]
MSSLSSLTRRLLAVALLGSVGVAQQSATPPVPVPVLATTGGDLTYLLGGWQGNGRQGGRWLTDAQVAARLGPAATYQAWTLGRATGTARGSRPGSMGEPCEQTLSTRMSPVPPEGALRVYLPAGLRAVPRPVQVLPPSNPTYTEIIRADLRRRGVAQPRVRVTGLTRTDLDGDGTQEVLIEARYFREEGPEGTAFSPPPAGQPGDYSLLLVRFVREGRAVTSTLAAYLGPKQAWDSGSDQPMPMANLYRLAGVADLDGDGRMELIVYSAYYEGQGFAVYSWTPVGGAKLRLETGCGV